MGASYQPLQHVFVIAINMALNFIYLLPGNGWKTKLTP